MVTKSFVEMNQQTHHGLSIVNSVVKVPVRNGIPAKALKLIPNYAWAKAANWDLAAKWVADERVGVYTKKYDNDLPIDHFEVMSMFCMPNGTILFADVYAYLKSAPTRANFVFWSGHTSSVIVLVTDENGKRWILVVEEMRIPVGRRWSVQLPAGIQDPMGNTIIKNSPAFQTALDELGQETSLQFENAKLQEVERIPLSQGRISEITSMFMLEVEMKSHEIVEMNGKLAGKEDENEVIRQWFIPVELMSSYANGNPMMAVASGIINGSWSRRALIPVPNQLRTYL